MPDERRENGWFEGEMRRMQNELTHSIDIQLQRPYRGTLRQETHVTATAQSNQRHIKHDPIILSYRYRPSPRRVRVVLTSSLLPSLLPCILQ